MRAMFASRPTLAAIAVALAVACEASHSLGVVDVRGPGAEQADAQSPTGAVPETQNAKPFLPPAQRLFHVSTPELSLLLGAQGTTLWAVDVAKKHVLWSRDGAGMVQAVVGGDIGNGWHLYAARGRGRGLLETPVHLEELDVRDGDTLARWSAQTPRADIAHLSISDANRDGRRELVLAYFDSKYFVRTMVGSSVGDMVALDRHRMATSMAWGDFDGDRKPERVIGRMYGDARGEPGDLHIITAKGAVGVPVQGGVRALVVLPGATASEAATLYFADGWTANYAAAAKAQLKRARLKKRGDGFVAEVELLGRSSKEYTYNRLVAVDRAHGERLLAYGSHALTLYSVDKEGVWQQTQISATPEHLAGVFTPGGRGITLALPGEAGSAWITLPASIR